MRLMLCLAACSALTACGEPIEVGAPPPPAERLVCEEMPAAPDLEPLEAISGPNGATVYRKAETDARDAQIARYIVALRGAWFSCSSQLKWNRDYHAGNQ